MDSVVGRKLVSAIGWLLVLTGCDDGDDESGRSQDCRAICAKLEMCNDATDLMGCEERCDEQTFRSDLYFSAKSGCAENSCNLWSSELGLEGEDLCEDSQCFLADCVGDELDMHMVSEEQEQLCEAVSNKLIACQSALNQALVARECEQRLLELSSEYAADSKACTERSCAEIVACLDALADQYDTTIKLFAGSL